MNRKFKFRVWDKLEKEWSSSSPSISFLSKKGYIEFEGSSYQRTNCIIQQFTGLKDKNGKEIYEGDILYYNDGSDDDRAEVVFDVENTMFKFNWQHDTYSGNWYRNDAEIIGNIFENPELLK